MNRKEILYRFFEITGDEKDSLVYLKKFREVGLNSFAIIYATPDCFSETGESLLFDLKLLQSLELYPILVVHETIPEYLKLFYGKLINFDNDNGDNVLNLHLLKSGTTRDKVREIIAEKKIPLCITKNFDGEDLFNEISELIHINNSTKFIYLSPERMFMEKDKNSSLSMYIFSESVTKELHLFNKKEISLLKKFEFLLKKYEDTLRSISVTTPVSLFKELFTVKGGGTFFKLGSRFNLVSVDMVDKDRLKKLLEISFKKKLKEDFLNSKIDSIILESDYRGAAIFRRTDYGILLSKFAVDEIARGEGIGREIWDKMKKEYKKIFWRANKKNPINKWYFKECDGVVKEKNWNIFWIGIPTKNIQRIINIAKKLPADFYE